MEIKEKTGFYRLSWMQRIGYGSGDLAQNLIFQTVACYLMLYLTTVLKINPAFVSGLILSVRLIDCFWSPIVGRYIDNRTSKLGKYRAYLLYGGIPLTVAACLLMLPQAATWSTSLKIVYATVSYTVLSMIYSVVNIPPYNRTPETVDESHRENQSADKGRIDFQHGSKVNHQIASYSLEDEVLCQISRTEANALQP